MVLAPDRVEVPKKPHLYVVPKAEPGVEYVREPVKVRATIKFLETITGRKIRRQQRINYQRLHSGKVEISGKPVDQYIGQVNDSFRDDPNIDVIAGADYAKKGRGVVRALRLLVRPGLTPLERALLAGSIPSSVPLDTEIVFKEWDKLIPEAKIHKRVTHTNHRLLPGEERRLRIP